MKIGHPIGMQRQDPSISRAWPAVALAVVLTGPPRVACQFQPPCYWCTTPSPLHDGFTFVGAGFCADGYLRGRNDVRSLDDCKAQVWRGRSSFRSDFAAAISGHKNNKITFDHCCFYFVVPRRIRLRLHRARRIGVLALRGPSVRPDGQHRLRLVRVARVR